MSDITADKAETVIVKVGTAAITTQDGKPDELIIASVARQAAMLKIFEGHHMVVVTSGAVAFGRDALNFGPEKNIVDTQMLASVGQPKLAATYDKYFSPYGLHAGQVLLTRSDFGLVTDKLVQPAQHPGRDMINSFDRMLVSRNVIPIVNENDVTATWELRRNKHGQFTDNDELAGLVARQVKATRLIILSNIDGVYNVNPKSDSRAYVIPAIDFADASTLPQSTNGKSGAGRGGMDSKMATAKMLANEGITVHIVNSRKDNAILRIMDGEPLGTRLFSSAPHRPDEQILPQNQKPALP